MCALLVLVSVVLPCSDTASIIIIYCVQATDFGYSVAGMDGVKTNCPKACGLCDLELPELETVPAPLECVDELGFRDAFGNGCSFWMEYASLGLNCVDSDSTASWGFTPEIMSEIIERCPASCGLCNEGEEPNMPSPESTGSPCAEVPCEFDFATFACNPEDCCEFSFQGLCCISLFSP